MTGDVRVGIAQWTPGRDPGVNLHTAESALRELARRGCRIGWVGVGTYLVGILVEIPFMSTTLTCCLLVSKQLTRGSARDPPGANRRPTREGYT